MDTNILLEKHRISYLEYTKNCNDVINILVYNL